MITISSIASQQLTFAMFDKAVAAELGDSATNFYSDKNIKMLCKLNSAVKIAAASEFFGLTQAEKFC